MLQITARTLADIVILDLEGRLVAEGGEQLLLVVSDLVIKEGARNIVLNFSALSQCDSMGISALLRIQTSILNISGQFRICQVNDLIAKVFQLTHMDEILMLMPTEAAAIAAMTPASILEG